MSSGSLVTANLSAVESQLSDGIPFGSYDYLSRHLSEVYLGLLTRVAEQSPAAEAFLRALDQVDVAERVFRDSLVRRTIEDGVGRVLGAPDAIDAATLDAVLSAATLSAGSGPGSLLAASAHCIPLGSSAGHGYAWADGAPETVSGRRFHEEVLKRLPGFRIELPTKEQVRTLITGQQLAFDLAPALARSALSHLFVVVVGNFEEGPPVNALTAPGLAGVMVLSPLALSTPSAVAETLLHESLHLKFLDIEYVHPLFVTGFRPYNSPRVTPVWHADEEGYGGWPVDRMLTSMHVYLSLAVLFAIAADRRGHDEFYPPDNCAARVQKCRTRAAWLYEAIQEHLDQLTPAGREFVASIGTMLSDLDGVSPD